MFVQQIINEILLRARCHTDKHREYSYLKGSHGPCLRQFYYNLQQKKTTFTSFIFFTFKTNMSMLQYFKWEMFFIIHTHTHRVEKKVREDNFCKNTFSILRVNQYTQSSNTCRNEKIYNWIFYLILHDLKNKYVSPKSLQEVKSVKGSVSQIII